MIILFSQKVTLKKHTNKEKQEIYKKNNNHKKSNLK